MLFLLLLFFLPLQAQEEKNFFQQEKLYFEISKGYSVFNSGSFVKNLENNNKKLFPVFFTPESFFIYSTREQPFNRPSLYTHKEKFLFEYGLTAKLGFGFTIQSYNFEVRGYNTTSLLSSLLYSQYSGLIEVGKEEQALSAINAYYLILKTNFTMFKSIQQHLHLSYHFLTQSRWDPYLRLEAGLGKTTTGTNTDSFALTMGTRYFFHPNFFFVADLQATKISVYKSKFEYFGTQIPRGDAKIIDINLGIGVIPWDKTEHIPYPKKQLKTQQTNDLKEIIELVNFPPEERKEYKNLIQKINQVKQKLNIEITLKRGKLTLILLQDAFFPSGEDEPYLSGIRAIKELTKILKSTQYIQFQIEGHTDNVQIKRPKTIEKFQDNQSLSFSRAYQVWEIMRQEGFPKERISIQAMADTDPRASNETERGRALNRRIEILADRDLSKYPEITELLNKNY